MRIALLTASLSENNMGRVFILAEMLGQFSTVSITGITEKKGIWPPLRNIVHLLIQSLGTYQNPIFSFFVFTHYLRRCDIDVIYVFKPALTLLLPALLLRRGKKIIVDIDDWESALIHKASKYSMMNIRMHYLRACKYCGELLVRFCDQRTTSNAFLAKKFDGVVIPHARSATSFETERKLSSAYREDFSLPLDKKIILFLGTPRRHKGIGILIDAVAQATSDVHLVIAGLSDDDLIYPEIMRTLNSKIPDCYTVLDFISWEKRYEVLQCADIIAIPQSDTSFTRNGQTPAKIFDAMAAGIPLIASEISDIPEILGGNGWLVEPDNALALAAMIEYVLTHPEQAREKALAAKKRFLENYSYDAVIPRLKALIESV